MKIQIEMYGEKLIFESPADDLTTGEMINKFCGLLIALGYMPKSVKRSILEMAEEINAEICSETYTSSDAATAEFLPDDNFPMNGDLG